MQFAQISLEEHFYVSEVLKDRQMSLLHKKISTFLLTWKLKIFPLSSPEQARFYSISALQKTEHFFCLNQSAHAVHLKSAQLPHQSVLPFDGNLGSTPTVTRPRGAGEATPTKHCLVASSDNLSMAINDGETCKSNKKLTASFKFITIKDTH